MAHEFVLASCASAQRRSSCRRWLVVACRRQEKTLKIGVLTDMSSVSADIMGAGSVLAAQMAVEDVGGTVAGMKIEIIVRRPSAEA